MKSGLIATRDGKWGFETLVKPWCECDVDEDCSCDDDPAFVVLQPTEDGSGWQTAGIPWLTADELARVLEGRVLPVDSVDEGGPL